MSGRSNRKPVVNLTNINPKATPNNSAKKQRSAETKRDRPHSSSPESTPPPKISTVMSQSNTPLTIDVIRVLLLEQTNALQVDTHSIEYVTIQHGK